MKVCECKGDITGIEFDSDKGLLLHADTYADYEPYRYSSEVVFPFNVNWPQRIDLNSLRGKKIKLTIEIVDDYRQS